MATTKKTNGKASMVKWDAELAALAQETTAVEANVGAGNNSIGTGGGILMYKGAKVPGNKMNVVIVDHVIEYAYYGTEAYDPDNPKAPICFGFGRDEKQMKPHEDVAERQNDKCDECPQNKWASAAIGKGKACKNVRRLALFTQGDLEDVANAEIAYLKVPVTSVKEWAGYVRQIAEVMKRPPLGVVTEVSLVESIDDSLQIGAIIEKRKTVAKDIVAPYVYIDNDESPARGGRKTAAKKGSAPSNGRRKF
jgi:hypothetical protein